MNIAAAFPLGARPCATPGCFAGKSIELPFNLLGDEGRANLDLVAAFPPMSVERLGCGRTSGIEITELLSGLRFILR